MAHLVAKAHLGFHEKLFWPQGTNGRQSPTTHSKSAHQMVIRTDWWENLAYNKKNFIRSQAPYYAKRAFTLPFGPRLFWRRRNSSRHHDLKGHKPARGLVTNGRPMLLARPYLYELLMTESTSTLLRSYGTVWHQAPPRKLHTRDLLKGHNRPWFWTIQRLYSTTHEQQVKKEGDV